MANSNMQSNGSGFVNGVTKSFKETAFHLKNIVSG